MLPDKLASLILREPVLPDKLGGLILCEPAQSKRTSTSYNITILR